MHVTSIGWEVGVGQGSSWSIKRVTIPVFIGDKLDLYVNTLTCVMVLINTNLKEYLEEDVMCKPESVSLTNVRSVTSDHILKEAASVSSTSASVTPVPGYLVIL